MLPETVDRWRGRNWAKIQKKEHQLGDALVLQKQIVHIMTRHKEAEKNGKLTRKMVESQADATIKLVSELTDEILMREEEIGLPVEKWNETYVNCMLHQWKNIPHAIRREIIKRTPKE